MSKSLDACRRGHVYADGNYWNLKNGYKKCKICDREGKRANLRKQGGFLKKVTEAEMCRLKNLVAT